MISVGNDIRHLNLQKTIDIRVAPCGVTMVRSHCLNKTGRFRLARRSCQLISLMVINPGAFARICIVDGRGRKIVEIPSPFTGSFQFGCEFKDGMTILVQGNSTPNLGINWRERDATIV